MRILVLGGGYEATKKVRRLLKYGPEITVYSLDFTQDLARLGMDNEVRLIKGDVRDLDRVRDLIARHDIIIYTVPSLPDIELKVRDICSGLRKIYIIATNSELTQSALPVEGEVHGLRITVFSDGKSTITSIIALKEVIEYLRAKKYLSTLLGAMHYLKRRMKACNIPYRVRMRKYREMVRDERFMDYVYRGDMDSARKYIDMVVERLARDHG